VKKSRKEGEKLPRLRETTSDFLVAVSSPAQRIFSGTQAHDKREPVASNAFEEK
jgi:hypothetical protein